MTGRGAVATPPGSAHSLRTWRALATRDFAVVLSAPPIAKSPHFVLHYLAGRPLSHRQGLRAALIPELSTTNASLQETNVDNIESIGCWWLGLVVPKRHAKRSVMRSLLKRQMRAAIDRHRDGLAPGQWLIRLRAPFDSAKFFSAASDELRDAARGELDRVFGSAIHA